jgi:small subunit ribosomal protein S4
VGHRHITLNGEIMNIPSCQVKVGDVIGVREKSKSLEVIERSLSVASHDLEWLTWNGATLEGTLVSVPTREQITENIKEQLIVELYSK